MFQLDKLYLGLSFILLALLTYIALFVHDQFVRPLLGDVLVVIWLYLFLASFIKHHRYKVAHFSLFFACAIELAQFFNLVTILGLENIKAARIIIGTTFDWRDVLAYVVGWAVILLIESYRLRLSNKRAGVKSS